MSCRWKMANGSAEPGVKVSRSLTNSTVTPPAGEFVDQLLEVDERSSESVHRRYAQRVAPAQVAQRGL